MNTVSSKDWPARKDWPKAGWKHALNADRFRPGDTFGFHDGGRLWSGIVEEIGPFTVKIKDVLPGVME